MSPTYKAIGINLKSMPLGESDRLVTVLTREFGLVRAVAPGARKHRSKLGGRTSLFVVNDLLISKGRTLDRISQAETLASYPGLSQDLGKLTAGQYLAELALFQALSDQPQEELFYLLNEHLRRLEQCATAVVLAQLTHGVFQLLRLAGIAPQVQACCLTQAPLTPNFTEPEWCIGFSAVIGGTVSLTALARWAQEAKVTISQQRPTPVQTRLNALELSLLQQLPQIELPPGLGEQEVDPSQLQASWGAVENLLRQYAQYHFDRPIRSAAIVDSCLTLALSSTL
ncbi:hypothetical protein DO97_06625 [Neosynechococcus sphagnicola sy1]|uniref:DNA repair protein RecO n=1 Tax=Neosynechococcus sphagnicola sy1 TaxID=1497020 RepID=A0A098TK32_9CYAN|nr:DNA repair protein RecO [Neosynechococcus sphagnicola]KGF72690.1 hypothetical protein DO97_06625 [Neosynechococcus sphagnicola sy1]